MILPDYPWPWWYRAKLWFVWHLMPQSVRDLLYPTTTYYGRVQDDAQQVYGK